MASPKKIAVIAMSVRTPRVGPTVARLVKDIISQDPEASSYDISLVEAASFKLPVFDESVLPMTVPAVNSFAHEHSKKWSAEIASHDAYVMVIPEYNGSMAGGTKNAIDYLYNEWIGKPLAIVSYGIGGGAKASAHAAGVLSQMKLRVAETRPALFFAKGFGPDANASIQTGTLGEESRARWETDGKPDILKAFGEVKTLLATPHEPAPAPKAAT